MNVWGVTLFIICAWCTCANGGAPATRNKYLWPFANTSFWNMPIGSAAQYEDIATNGVVPVPKDGYFIDTEPIVSSYGNWNNPLQGIYGVGISPLYCFIPGGFVQTFPNNYYPIPDNYTYPCGGIANYAGGIVYHENAIKEFNYLCRCDYAAPMTLGEASYRDSLLLDGDGLPIHCGGHGGSCLSGFGGSIRRGELTNDLTNVDTIRHAIKFTFNMQRFGNQTNKAFHWPAVSADGYALNNDSQAYGHLAKTLGYQTNSKMGMGALLAIPTSVNLDQLGLKTMPGKKIAWTLQNYGGYIVDDSYEVPPGVPFYRQALCAEVNVSLDLNETFGYTIPTNDSTSPLKQDLDIIYSNLKVVVNNGVNTTGGGGTPLQDLAPPFQTSYTSPTVGPCSSTNVQTLTPSSTSPSPSPSSGTGPSPSSSTSTTNSCACTAF